jgi:hypothetical protein
MAGPTLKQDLQAQEAREAQAQFDADNQRGLENVYREFKELIRCEANERLIADYCEPMSINLTAFQLAMDNPAFRNSLAWASVDDQRKVLMDEIVKLLSAAGGGGFDVHALQAEKKNRLQWQSLNELIARRDSILREREIRKLSPDQRKQILVDARPNLHYPRLPRTIVPRGQVQAVPLDSAYIRRLDPESIRRLNRIYSVEAVNDRLLGRD